MENLLCTKWNVAQTRKTSNDVQMQSYKCVIYVYTKISRFCFM